MQETSDHLLYCSIISRFEKYSSCTSLGCRGRTETHIPDVIETKIHGRDSLQIFFFSLFFIHLEGMQVQCTTKTQHQAVESRRDEAAVRGGGGGGGRGIERRGPGFKGQPEVVQSVFSTRCLSQLLQLITVWLLLVRRPRAGLFWTEEGKIDLKRWSKDDLDHFAPFVKNVREDLCCCF